MRLADPGTGPVAAIAAGLRAASHEIAVVIPVDMPLLTAAASARARSPRAAMRRLAQHGPLPCAVARRALPAFETDERRLRAVLAGLDTARVELDAALLAQREYSGRPRYARTMSGVFRVGGDEYDSFMGRYSRGLAPLFADFAGVGPGDRVLDVGAGTGAAYHGAALAAALPPRRSSRRPSSPRSLRERFPGLEVEQAPAESIPFADGVFDAALAQLVVAFMADAPAAIAEMARVARRVAVCMWGVAEVDMFAAIDKAAAAVGASSATEPRRYRTPQELHDLLAPHGEVEAAELDVTAGYRDFDEFWEVLGRGVGPVGAWLASLDGGRREQARAELHGALGGPEGPFELKARAFAAAVTPA